MIKAMLGSRVLLFSYCSNANACEKLFIPNRLPASSDALFSKKDLLSIVSVDLLNLAGVRPEAEQVRFVAADGKYSANLRLDEVMGEGMLIAYAFEDKPLPKVHGFPLRVVAKDQQGNRWVKWLGEIVVQ